MIFLPFLTLSLLVDRTRLLGPREDWEGTLTSTPWSMTSPKKSVHVPCPKIPPRREKSNGHNPDYFMRHKWAQLRELVSLQPHLDRVKKSRHQEHLGLTKKIQRNFIHLLFTPGLFSSKFEYGENGNFVKHESFFPFPHFACLLTETYQNIYPQPLV